MRTLQAETDGEIKIETWYTHDLYKKLKEAWTLAKAGVAVNVDAAAAIGTS